MPNRLPFGLFPGLAHDFRTWLLTPLPFWICSFVHQEKDLDSPLARSDRDRKGEIPLSAKEGRSSRPDANRSVKKNLTPENRVFGVFEFERRFWDTHRPNPKGVPSGKLEVQNPALTQEVTRLP